MAAATPFKWHVFALCEAFSKVKCSARRNLQGCWLGWCGYGCLLLYECQRPRDTPQRTWRQNGTQWRRPQTPFSEDTDCLSFIWSPSLVSLVSHITISFRRLCSYRLWFQKQFAVLSPGVVAEKNPHFISPVAGSEGISGSRVFSFLFRSRRGNMTMRDTRRAVVCALVFGEKGEETGGWAVWNVNSVLCSPWLPLCCYHSMNHHQCISTCKRPSPPKMSRSSALFSCVFFSIAKAPYLALTAALTLCTHV